MRRKTFLFKRTYIKKNSLMFLFLQTYIRIKHHQSKECRFSLYWCILNTNLIKVKNDFSVQIDMFLVKNETWQFLFIFLSFSGFWETDICYIFKYCCWIRASDAHSFHWNKPVTFLVSYIYHILHVLLVHSCALTLLAHC